MHVASDAPPVEYAPVGQGPVHATVVSPVVDPYLPPGQGVHAAVDAPPVE